MSVRFAVVFEAGAGFQTDLAKLSPKRVLRQLAQNDRGRERRCWSEDSLTVLRQRGDDNGLAAYLQEVRDLLAPLIGHVL
jgi:hypothetical protein